uniref:Odorant-binding protein 21 n=1 Tax=Chouioia cunea TaxID=1570515 RepID=A0A6B9CJU4_9HYME|nr:odorant-binding protein 21 [Chouioia cunea]
MNVVAAIVFTLCSVGAFAGLIEGDVSPPKPNITKECLKEYGIDIEQTNGAPLSDEEIYCIPACAYKDYGIMRPDGTIDSDKAESYFGVNDHEERSIFFSVYEVCREGKTHCKLVQCMFDNLKNHWKSSSKSKKVTRQLFSQLV